MTLRSGSSISSSVSLYAPKQPFNSETGHKLWRKDAVRIRTLLRQGKVNLIQLYPHVKSLCVRSDDSDSNILKPCCSKNDFLSSCCDGAILFVIILDKKWSCKRQWMKTILMYSTSNVGIIVVGDQFTEWSERPRQQIPTEVCTSASLTSQSPRRSE